MDIELSITYLKSMFSIEPLIMCPYAISNKIVTRNSILRIQEFDLDVAWRVGPN